MGLMEGGEENSRQWDVLWKVLRVSSVVLNGMVVGWWVYSYLSYSGINDSVVKEKVKGIDI